MHAPMYAWTNHVNHSWPGKLLLLGKASHFFTCGRPCKKVNFKIINQTSYNLRKLIQKTWKLIQPIENNIEDSDKELKIDIGIECSDSDSDCSNDSE